ncbi:MAG: DUF4363 family protein [Ruminococcaceae bacterium]|nr:DUF4363 family protein [Oscillospiraceae bacterium]
MKLFIASLITLALICGLCVWGTIYGAESIDGLILALEEAKSASDMPKNAADIYENLSAKWEESSFSLSLLLPHHHLDEVKEKLVRLGAYSDTDEFAEWHDAVLGLGEEFEHIRGLVGISIDNIL